MRPGPFIGAPHSEIELIYTAIIVVICLLIYFKTKELYALSLHKGIKYFRDAFLFLAAGYIFRVLGVVFSISRDFFVSPRSHFMIGGFLFSFTSTMAIICLIYSISWKQNTKKSFVHKYLLPLLAVVVPLASVLIRSRAFRSHILVIAFQIILFGYVIYLSYKHHKKKTSRFHIIYLLLFLFWIVNFVIAFIPRFMLVPKIILYGASVALFVVILLRVLKRTRLK